MAFISAPLRTVRAVHKITVQGEDCLNVIYFYLGTGTLTSADAITFANDLHGIFETTLFSQCSNEATLETVEVTDVTTASGLQVTSTVAAAAGPVAQPAVSNALSFLITFLTPFSGRSNRGRIFIPGLRDDVIDTDSNYWEPSVVSGSATALQEQSADWLAAVEALTPIGATNASPVVASYYSGTYSEEDPPPPGKKIGDPIPREEAIVTGITSTRANRRIAIQRRRRPRS